MNEALSPLYDFFVTKMPYITITLTVLGFALMINRWLSAPKGPKGPPINLGAAIKYFFLDLVLFRKTWKTGKATWLLVALFHWSTYGIIFGHLRGFGWWSIQLFEPLGHAFAEFMVETLPVQDWFYWHVFFTQLFIIYIPFSKMIHIFTSVVTSTLYGSRRKEYGI